MHASVEKAGAVGALTSTLKGFLSTRSTLHAVNRYLKQRGHELPPLEFPTVRWYGKDGEKGGKQLVITAQVPLFETDLFEYLFLYNLIVIRRVCLVSTQYHSLELMYYKIVGSQ